MLFRAEPDQSVVIFTLQNFLRWFFWASPKFWSGAQIFGRQNPEPKFGPHGAQKNTGFQYRVNHPYSHPRSKVTSYSVFMIFWFSNEFAKISLFRLKLWKNLQSLQGCKNTLRPHNDTCDTAFESLGVIVFNMIIFGYYSGTQNTQNITYVRHLK